jgi:glucose-1-phosphate adenylyltransferase
MDDLNVATVILAGGKGERLYPLTLHHCKPAISYAGRYRLIDVPISNSIHSRFSKIFVLAQYLSGELQHHISQTYHFGMFQNGSIDFLTPQENELGQKEWFTGTADAVRKSLPTLLKSEADYFLILSGDQLYNIDLRSMVELAREKDADMTIAATPFHHTLSERFGVLRIDENGFIQEFSEKPKSSETNPFHLPQQFFQSHQKETPSEPHLLASMGIYVFKRDALISLLRRDQREDFGRHLINTALQSGKTAAFIYDGYWEDIGTVKSYYEANLLLTSGHKGINLYDEERPIYTRATYLPGPKISSSNIKDSIICDGSRIEAAEIENCVIGMRSQVGEGTILKNSVLLGNHFYMPPTHQDRPIKRKFLIGENCRIERAIIDENVKIGNNVTLTNASKQPHFDGDGVFIRDGIILITAGTVLQDHFIL